MRELIDDIVVGRLDLHEALAHRSRICPVFGRTGQTDSGCHLMLLGLEIVELILVTERPSGVTHLMSFHLFGFGSLHRYTFFVRPHTFDHRKRTEQQNAQDNDVHYPALFDVSYERL